MKTLRLTTAHYFRSEDGAVTVDWVVLTAALAALGIATTLVVSGGVENISGDVASQMANQEISTRFASPFERQQWDAHNPGIYEEYSSWMADFEDDNLLEHYNNTAQWANAEPNSGHPIDTYHDEFWIARDEAIVRGLVDEGDPIPTPTT
jgi:Flp pilus assembly pilin Flp